MTGLYLHIPFCLRKCPYCDFFSLAGHSDQQSEYVQLLLTQMELYRRGQDHPELVDTVFFGGGTPSLLEPAEIGKILRKADFLWGLSKDAEITIEANPGTLSREKLQGYRAAGVNRLSLGVQTFDPPSLKFLGRLHSQSDVENGLFWARRAGFQNIGIDLIFGLPGQTRKVWRRDLKKALEFEPEHLSLYGLTVEEGTDFARLRDIGKLSLPDENIWADMYQDAHDFLGGHGYAHYEISNYSKPGHQCLHNLIYWQRQPYMGFGAGAHSFLDYNWGERWASPPDLGHYVDCLQKGLNPSRCLETFSCEKARNETLYLGLRTAEGVREENFARTFGETVREAYPEVMKRLENYLVFMDGCYRMTFDGWLIYDFLIREFL